MNATVWQRQKHRRIHEHHRQRVSKSTCRNTDNLVRRLWLWRGEVRPRVGCVLAGRYHAARWKLLGIQEQPCCNARPHVAALHCCCVQSAVRSAANARTDISATFPAARTPCLLLCCVLASAVPALGFSFIGVLMDDISAYCGRTYHSRNGRIHLRIGHLFV